MEVKNDALCSECLHLKVCKSKELATNWITKIRNTIKTEPEENLFALAFTCQQFLSHQQPYSWPTGVKGLDYVTTPYVEKDVTTGTPLPKPSYSVTCGTGKGKIVLNSEGGSKWLQTPEI
jgi:hypothetical protein